MIKAIGIGVIILTFALISIYRSVVLSLVMIVVLSLSMIGASWACVFRTNPAVCRAWWEYFCFSVPLLKIQCCSSNFTRWTGKAAAPFDAAVESVRIRYRPVMMTALGTIAGMIPIALERAVGLERL